MKPDDPDVGKSITTLASREVYRNHWLRLREDRILRSNGKEGIYSVVEKCIFFLLPPKLIATCVEDLAVSFLSRTFSPH